MSSAVRDTEEACRSAAHKALASMDIKAEIISSLFDLGTAGEYCRARDDIYLADVQRRGDSLAGAPGGQYCDRSRG